MGGFLKQATASQSRLLGPFVDDTDGTTAETGLTIANTDIRLSVNGGNMAAKNSGGGTHDELGYYTITLDATDTATVGHLKLVCKMSGALVVEDEYWVLEEAIYDALFAASAAAFDANQRVDVGSWIGTAVTLSSNSKPDVNVDEWHDVALATTNPLPNAAANGAGGLPISDAGGLDLDTLNSNVSAILTDTGTTLPGVLGTPIDFGSGTSTLAANLQDMADNGTATFDRSTDSLQALRDHIGDGTNLTEAGGTGDHLTAIDLPDQTMNITGNITGNLSGSVGSVTTVSDKTGYSISGTKTTLDALNDVAATDIVSSGAITTSSGAVSNVTTVGSVTTKTGYALTAAYDFAKGTSAMTESYAANGAAPTPVQAIFAVHQMLMDFSISGTTVTVKKLDDSTTAFSATLNDATTPTAIARI